MTVPAPATVRQAAVLVALEGAAAVLAAVLFVIRGFTGADQHIVNGFGTGATIAVLGAAVLTAGWALWNGRAWGRGIAVFAQLLLLPRCRCRRRCRRSCRSRHRLLSLLL